VDLADRFLPAGTSRTAALAIVYVLLIGLLAVLGIVIGTRVAAQAAALAAKAPDVLSRLATPGELPLPQPVRDALPSILQQIQEHSAQLLSYIPKAGLQVLSAAGNLIYAVIVPILSFFFLKDGRRVFSATVYVLSDYVPKPMLEDILADLHLLLGQYIRALVILSAATFIFYGMFFALLGVPYAILLASVAAPLEFIPMIGPLAAAIIIVLVAGLGGSEHLLAILVFLGAYRLFQDYVLQPHLMSSGTELHPLAIIFGAFAGGAVAGVMGTFLSVPAMATLRIVYRRLRKSRQEPRLAPTPP